MASTKLTRTHGTATNTKKYTWSAWIKRGLVGTQETLVRTRTSDSNYARFRTDPDKLEFSDVISSSVVTSLISNEKLRDPNAWYHVVLKVDYTQANAADRAKIYLNGSEVSYATSTRQSQNGDSFFNSANSHAIGTYNDNHYFNGAMSHVHFTDGYAYDASTFGSTDATTGEWKINTAPSVTYGTNGYFVLKDSNGVTDQSGNSNNFTVGGGTLTNTEDNPSNVFNTLNLLTKDSSDTLANGNLKWTAASGAGYSTVLSTLGFNTGKYYAEAKIVSASTYYPVIGIASSEASSYYYQPASRDYIGQSTGSAGLFMHGDIRIDNSAGSPAPASYTTNDIVGLAVDLDSATKTLKIYKNGTLDQTYTISAPKGFYHFGCSGGGTTSDSVAWNFGNGFFGTTAISSEGTNASNLGKFEYDVPAGYTALCTKGLNE